MYKVLIVEPQEFSLKALLNLPVWGKGQEGFVCTKTASNGEEALTLLQTMEFDLVLTEINLSIFDGLQLLKQIHRDNENPLIAFISDRGFYLWSL
jgi:two-component system response regulator YesN